MNRRAQRIVIVLGAALLAVLGAGVFAQAPAPPPPPGMGGLPMSMGSFKVAEEFHVALSEDDFKEDLTGEKRRNPFRSFLSPSGPLALGNRGSSQIKRNVVAKEKSRAEIELMAIMQRKGGKWFAMFTDTTGRDHITSTGDYLTKDEFRVVEILSNKVVIDMGVVGKDNRPVTEVIKLFPDEMKPPKRRGRPILTDRTELQGDVN